MGIFFYVVKKERGKKKANCFPMNHTVSWHKEDKGRKLDVKLCIGPLTEEALCKLPM